MAAPVQRKGEAAIDVITVAGPLVCLTEQRMLERGLELLAVAAELASASSASPLFARSTLSGRTEPALETLSS